MKVVGISKTKYLKGKIGSVTLIAVGGGRRRRRTRRRRRRRRH
jgi:hypothetical protein